MSPASRHAAAVPEPQGKRPSRGSGLEQATTPAWTSEAENCPLCLGTGQVDGLRDGETAVAPQDVRLLRRDGPLGQSSADPRRDEQNHTNLVAELGSLEFNR